MPIYEYRCPMCERETEEIRSFSEADDAVCKCGAKLDRLISRNTSAHFKGPGFYCNDYPNG